MTRKSADIVDGLERLAQLRDAHHISEEEFSAAKARLLSAQGPELTARTQGKPEGNPKGEVCRLALPNSFFRYVKRLRGESKELVFGADRLWIDEGSPIEYRKIEGFDGHWSVETVNGINSSGEMSFSFIASHRRVSHSATLGITQVRKGGRTWQEIMAWVSRLVTPHIAHRLLGQIHGGDSVQVGGASLSIDGLSVERGLIRSKTAFVPWAAVRGWKTEPPLGQGRPSMYILVDESVLSRGVLHVADPFDFNWIARAPIMATMMAFNGCRMLEAEGKQVPLERPPR